MIWAGSECGGSPQFGNGAGGGVGLNHGSLCELQELTQCGRG